MILGVTVCGATTVPLNPRSTEAEFLGLLGQLGAGGRLRAVITDTEHRSVLERAVSALPTAPPILDPADLTAPPHTAGGPLAEVDEQDVAIMIPTSGTTGRSKLVMQTHRTHVMSGEGFPAWLGLGPDDRLMTAMPMFHTNALAYSTMGSLVIGTGLVILPRFSASGFLDDARLFGATSFNAVGAMLEMLMAQTPREDDAATPLHTAYVAPALPREEHVAFERRFGLRIVCGYGLSESPYGLIWPPESKPFGTLGVLRQHPTLGVVNEARVVDDEGNDVAGGETGELLLRNPTVTPGYYGMPAESAAALSGGWLHTGDLVTAGTDGTYTFVARKKEVIRRRGENLSPAEVADAIRQHPDVEDCAVVGVPAGASEEEIKAYVVPSRDAQPDPVALRDAVAKVLAPYKVPRYWQFIDALPLTPTGRVRLRDLPDPEDGEIDLARPAQGVS